MPRSLTPRARWILWTQFQPTQIDVFIEPCSSKAGQRMFKRINYQLWAILLPLAMLSAQASYGADRTLTAGDLNIARGQTSRMSVSLESQANEASVAFSLCFDPSVLSFIDAVRGVDGTNASATLTVTPDQASSGQIGLVLSLPAGQAFSSAGSKTIVEVVFRAASSSTNVSTP